MPTFEEQTPVATDVYPIAVKAVIADSWSIHSIKNNEAEASLLAASLVGSPHNYAMAQVCLPVGNLYKDTE